MYTREQYEQAIELRKQGLTYSEIAKKLNLKTTNAVLGWTKKGRLPKGRFLNSNFNKLSPELGYILGVIEGDGYIGLKETKGHIGLTVKDKDFALYFKKQLELWSGISASFKQRKDTKHYVTTLYSLRAAQFLKNFNVSNFKRGNNKIKGAFLSGFFDAEGGVSGSNLNSPKISSRFVCAFNSDKKLILFIKELIESLGIRIQNIDQRTGIGFNKKGISYRLRIGGKENLEKFKEKIGFSIKRKDAKLQKVLESYKFEWWSKEEMEEIISMYKNGKYNHFFGSPKCKANHILMANDINKKFHSGKKVRTPRAVNLFLHRYRKKTQ